MAMYGKSQDPQLESMGQRVPLVPSVLMFHVPSGGNPWVPPSPARPHLPHLYPLIEIKLLWVGGGRVMGLSGLQLSSTLCQPLPDANTDLDWPCWGGKSMVKELRGM